VDQAVEACLALKDKTKKEEQDKPKLSKGKKL
jgi:hypothetical protein